MPSQVNCGCGDVAFFAVQDGLSSARHRVTLHLESEQRVVDTERRHGAGNVTKVTDQTRGNLV